MSINQTVNILIILKDDIKKELNNKKNTVEREERLIVYLQGIESAISILDNNIEKLKEK